MPDLCERIIPRVVQTVNGRFIAAVQTKCSAPAVDILLVVPPTPDETSFDVAVCKAHAMEIVDREPIDESKSFYCEDCRCYTHPATGYCGCP